MHETTTPQRTFCITAMKWNWTDEMDSIGWSSFCDYILHEKAHIRIQNGKIFILQPLQTAGGICIRVVRFTSANVHTAKFNISPSSFPHFSWIVVQRWFYSIFLSLYFSHIAALARFWLAKLILLFSSVDFNWSDKLNFKMKLKCPHQIANTFSSAQYHLVQSSLPKFIHSVVVPYDEKMCTSWTELDIQRAGKKLYSYRGMIVAWCT